MRRAAALLCFALASCQEPPDAGPAKEAVAARFAYPSSVEFHGLHAGLNPRQVCGEARGRLALDGAMSDWRKFNWQPRQGALYIEGVSDIRSDNQDLDTSMARLNDSMLQLGCRWD